MAEHSKKRIEEAAVTALNAALLRCKYLEPYIATNDKTPSWDGMVLVYRKESQSKSNIMGRVPVQVKGTGKRIISDRASYSCDTTDLKIYYQDGGCILFLVSVDVSSGWHRIYYASLLTLDLDRILKAAGSQKSYTIKLKRFPEENENDMANIFMSFVANQAKQMSFIGKDIRSIEELAQNGLDIESLTFGTTGVGIKVIENYLTTHDFYLYARIKGLDLDIPVEKVSDAVLSRAMDGDIIVNGRKYYDSYNVIYQNGTPHLQIGKGICFTLNGANNKSEIKFKPTGTLTDFITDTAFFIDIIEHRGVSIKGVNIPLADLSANDVDVHRKGLSYFMDIQKMLDALGVSEELECDNLSEQDQTNLQNFVKAVLYGRRIGFPQMDAPIFYGAFKIANLAIHIWARRHKDGHYTIENFFSDRSIVLFNKDDIEQAHPISSSHYLLLKQKDFEHSSNMDYDKIFEGLSKTEYSPQFMGQAVLLLLEILKGYDAQKEKDAKLLELADRVCKWIEATDPDVEPDIVILNKLQIVKRKRNLDLDEMILLADLKGREKPANIRCGAYLLLGDNDKAQSCFEEMEDAVQDEFITYPICTFGNLKNKHSNNPSE